MIRKKPVSQPSESREQAKPNLRKPPVDEDAPRKSLLKKSEISIVFVGAGIITLVVFFFFFRPSTQDTASLPRKGGELTSLEQRIERLEGLVEEAAAITNTPSSGQEGQPPALDTYQARVERVEAALSVKFDSLSKRLDILENRLSTLSKDVSRRPVAASPPSSATSSSSSQASSADSGGRTPEPAATASAGKTHVVKKGETLYAISRLYNLTVPELRELNNMQSSSDIWPGDTLIVGK